MGLIGRLLSSWYTGRGFSKFTNHKWEEAAALFEKAIKLDPNSGKVELTYSCLGRCYLALNRTSEAKKNLSMAYNLYQKNISSSLANRFEVQQYKELLKAYSNVLQKAGDSDLAQEMARKAEEIPIKEVVPDEGKKR